MTATRTDITTRADIEQLVDRFYAQVRADPLLGVIFDEIARVDWDVHLPRLYDFWDAVLFGFSTFKGNPLAAHLTLAGKAPLGDAEFRRWLSLFHAQVDELFSGPRADDAKIRSTRIAAMMQHHIAAAVARP